MEFFLERMDDLDREWNEIRMREICGRREKWKRRLKIMKRGKVEWRSGEAKERNSNKREIKKNK